VSWKFGAIVENESFRGGFRPVMRTWDERAAERYDAFLEMVETIEPNASVSATDRVGAHVSSRPEVHRLDHDVETDYFLIHHHDLRGRNKTILDRRKKEGSVELVRQEGSVSLYRRVSPPEAE
jgi:hypothetical protein